MELFKAHLGLAQGNGRTEQAEYVRLLGLAYDVLSEIPLSNPADRLAREVMKDTLAQFALASVAFNQDRGYSSLSAASRVSQIGGLFQ